jgi:transcriptional regulator with XRE-family HTH domain
MRQADIYKKVGITSAYISMILAGKRAPGWPLAKKLQRVTGVHPKYWMESMTNPNELNAQLTKKGYEHGKRNQEI